MPAAAATVLAGAALWGLHMGLTQGLLAALVADAAPADLRGTAFGVFNLVCGVALLVASALAGWLWGTPSVRRSRSTPAPGSRRWSPWAGFLRYGRRLTGVCERLDAGGVRVSCAATSGDLLDPTLDGRGRALGAREGGARGNVRTRPSTAIANEDWKRSPFFHLLEAAPRSCAGASATRIRRGEFPLLDTLQDQGATDYVAFVTRADPEGVRLRRHPRDDRVVDDRCAGRLLRHAGRAARGDHVDADAGLHAAGRPVGPRARC